MLRRGPLATSTFVSALLASAAAIADPAAGWGGFYVDGAIGARGSTTEVTRTERYAYSESGPGLSISYTDFSTARSDFGETNFLAQISGGWRWADGPVVVGIGAFVDLAGDGAGTEHLSGSRSTILTGRPFGGTFTDSESYGDNLEIKQSNRYGISLDIGPNWRTHPYAKLAYAWSEYEVDASTTCLGGEGPTSFSLSNNVDGFAIGGGVRHLQTDNLYFFAEAMWQDFGNASDRVPALCGNLGSALPPGAIESATSQLKIEPTNLTGVVGIGWKF